MNALQPPPAVHNIPAPPVPHAPATEVDLMHADSYADALAQARIVGVASLAEVATSRVYQLQVLQQLQAAGANNLAAGPPWFQQAIAQINARFDRVDANLRSIQVISALSYNKQCHDGRHTPFVEVPFRNGDMPTELPHDLPILENFDDVENLTAVQSARYWHGYCGGNLPGEQLRLARIRKAIGCTAGE